MIADSILNGYAAITKVSFALFEPQTIRDIFYDQFLRANGF